MVSFKNYDVIDWTANNYDTYVRGGNGDFEKWWRSMSKEKFQMVSDGLNRPKNIRNCKFLTKYFYQHFQILAIFIRNESLPMKSYQIFKICKRFNTETEKNTYAAVNEKRKTEKSWTLFYNRLFYKVFNMIINHFFVLQAHSQPNFCFLISG